MSSTNGHEDLGRERALEELLSRAEPRPVPPRQDEQIIRRAVRAEWDRVTKRRARNRWLTNFAVAAAIFLAVLVTLNLLRGPFDTGVPQQVASVEKQFGIIKVMGRERADSGATEISSIGSGQSAKTGDESGLTLAWNEGGSLRLDQNTRVEFESASEIYLRSGRIYFDSMPSGVPSVRTDPEEATLAIRTDTGMVRHIGTQFMTQTDGEELSVMVREGRVTVEANRVTETASVGQKLTVSRNGRISLEDVGVSGGDWQWIEKTSPPYSFDDRPIIEFLTWVSRESGRPLRFASRRAEQTAETKELRGVTSQEPSRALEIFMPVTGLAWRIEDGVILVGDGP